MYCGHPLKNVLAVKQKTIVMQALVMSILNYANIIWLCGRKNKNSVERIIRSCARFVLCKGKYDSISQALSTGIHSTLL